MNQRQVFSILFMFLFISQASAALNLMLPLLLMGMGGMGGMGGFGGGRSGLSSMYGSPYGNPYSMGGASMFGGGSGLSSMMAPMMFASMLGKRR